MGGEPVPSRDGAPTRSGDDLLGDTAVLIPALDEEEVLPDVLKALPIDRLLAVVVADNGSVDRTREVARAHGAAVVVERERGYGAACLAGIRHLAELSPRPRILVFVDADHPEDAARIPALLEPLRTGADLVLGVRVDEGGGTGNIHTHARWGNRLVLATTRLLFGRAFRDLAPFRAIRFQALEGLEMDDRNWGWTLQMQIRAVKRGLAIVEIPLEHRPRRGGRSKISGRLGTSVRVGLTMFRTLARERLQ